VSEPHRHFERALHDWQKLCAEQHEEIERLRELEQRRIERMQELARWKERAEGAEQENERLRAALEAQNRATGLIPQALAAMRPAEGANQQ
jgi:cell shape-determining protein MreC